MKKLKMNIQFFGTFLGQLGSNEIFAPLYNMIISQEVIANNIAGTFSNLVDKSRVDGSLYGDQKLYYSTDCLKSYNWGNDAEAENLLKLFRPNPPKVQAIILNKFRQIPVTIDMYLSKRAWSTEGAFSSFTSVMLGWIGETKKIYDSTTYNAFVGTDETAVGKQKISITLPTNQDAEKQARLQAQTIARAVADLEIKLRDVSRDYNDNGFLRSHNVDDLVFVTNADWINNITIMDLPTIYHKDGLTNKLTENVIPGRYFGKVNASGGTTSGTNTTIRALVEMDFNTVALGKPGYDPKKHVFPGDLLPNTQKYDENTTYTEDNTIIFKVMHRKSVPFMSAFETATSFFNPKSLTENHYLTWGHNTLEHLKEFPMITVRGTIAA